MFGRGFFDDLRNDPFFSGVNNHFREMDAFFGGGRDEFPALPSGRTAGRGEDSRIVDDRHRRNNEVSPFGPSPFGFGSLFGFGGMEQMFNEMHRTMESARNDPNAFSYSQSSVMTFSNQGDGEPQIYQATSSSRQAPGGIRETRKAVRDSVAGTQRMEVGHHIGDRSKVVEHEVDMRTGQQNERSDFIGMREDDGNAFSEEWRRRTSQVPRGHHALAQGQEPAHRPAITDGNERRKKSKTSRKPHYYVEEA